MLASEITNHAGPIRVPCQSSPGVGPISTQNAYLHGQRDWDDSLYSIASTKRRLSHMQTGCVEALEMGELWRVPCLFRIVSGRRFCAACMHNRSGLMRVARNMHG